MFSINCSIICCSTPIGRYNRCCICCSPLISLYSGVVTSSLIRLVNSKGAVSSITHSGVIFCAVSHTGESASAMYHTLGSQLLRCITHWGVSFCAGSLTGVSFCAVSRTGVCFCAVSRTAESASALNYTPWSQTQHSMSIIQGGVNYVKNVGKLPVRSFLPQNMSLQASTGNTAPSCIAMQNVTPRS